jgi:translocation and assembly module TamB
LSLYGQVTADFTGGWRQGSDLFLDGRAAIEGGRFGWQEEELQLGADLRKAELVLAWRGEELLAEADFELNQHGRLRGRLQWPLAARWPVQVDPQAPIRGEMTASLAEKGLLAALFPGLVRESSGQLEVAATLAGPPADPRLAGTFSLSGAAAYLPVAGLSLRDVRLRGRLANEEIELEEARITSGDGTLIAQGKILLNDWALADYRFNLSGENVEAVNLPELQLHISPELEISGDAERLRLRGKVLVPYAMVRGRESEPPIRSSPDLVLVDAPEEAAAELPLELDAAVRVILGERVLVKASGVDARLGGEVEILARNLEEINGRGRIEIKEGAYSAYGIGLKVERGNILFAGGPVDRPTLDILALRNAGEVKAGVRVTGTPRQPLVKLYSDPLMPDTDILSYMVLGRPLGAAGGDTDLLMTAAGVLLSQGESVVLQDRLKRRLGIDVLEVQAGSGDVSSSVVTIGKYLSPRLYISLGHSLFTSTNEFRMRYRLFERWELESSVGVESGADLYYLIEFE